MNDKTCIVFRIGSQKFCVDIEKVKEVSAGKDSIYVPGSPEYIIGVINLRGSIVPIINLAKKLKINSDVTNAQHPIIVTEMDELQLGFSVDDVVGIIHVKEEEFSQTPSILHVRSNFIDGVIRRDEEMIILLDLDKTMSDIELEQVRTLQEEQSVR